MIGAEFRDFLSELRDNNNKTWFEENKPRYQEVVVTPLMELVGTLEGPLADLTPALRAEPKVNGSFRRIYRDVRFSKDKTPYNTHVHLVFWAGNHPNRSPGVHVAFHPDGFGFGAGHWALDNEQLDRMRQQIMSDGGDAISTAVDAVAPHGVVPTKAALARVPRGFDKDAEGAEWLKHKGLVVRNELVPFTKELETLDGATQLITGICKKMSPVNMYLMEHVWS